MTDEKLKMTIQTYIDNTGDVGFSEDSLGDIDKAISNIDKVIKEINHGKT